MTAIRLAEGIQRRAELAVSGDRRGRRAQERDMPGTTRSPLVATVAVGDPVVGLPGLIGLEVRLAREALLVLLVLKLMTLDSVFEESDDL